ncbi:hypothetical protein M8818_003718 [Zalaria obscura]|uniref:Uncharacterized protein n=1 Tax=Zalaria obscura TaxID=2024903 RepID=A0ACC3SE27_9PEZI
MSKDLFAEFGDFATSQDAHVSHGGQEQHPSSTLWGENVQANGTSDVSPYPDWKPTEANINISANLPAHDTDDWGDFETAENEATAASTVTNQHHPSQSLFEEDFAGLTVEPNPPRATDTRRRAERPSQISSKHPFARNPDILFDADDPAEAEYSEPEDDEDDFGDFERVEPASQTRVSSRNSPPHPPSRQQPASFDLLGLDPEPLPSTTKPSTRVNPVSTPPSSHPMPGNRNPTGRAQQATNSKRAVTKPSPAPKRSTPKPPTQRPPLQDPLEDDVDAWDDFDTVPAAPNPEPPTNTNSPHSAPQPSTQPPSIPIPAPIFTLPASAHPPPNTLPPTNIPPPSLLLSLTASQLTTLTTLPTTLSPILTSPALHAYLTSYLSLLTLTAHLLAGRKLRWKRDRVLSQAMSIGPAGRQGGMKLAGIDRAEVAREEGAVEEVVAVWKKVVGRLRGVVGVVNAAVAAATTTTATATATPGNGAGGVVGGGTGKGTALQPLPPLPSLAPTLPVRVAKTSEGAVPSVRACGLCGLKREERVAKVDGLEGAVLDAFGEWWVQGVEMHSLCWAWWDGVGREGLRGR